MTKAFFHLSSAIIFSVEGKDAQRYLNARLSNDIKSLTPGHFCQAGMLTAQGRTQGLFRVLAIAPTNFILICDGGEPVQVTAALKKFIVADRVTVTTLSDKSAPSPLQLLHALEPFPPHDGIPSLGELQENMFSQKDSSFLFATKRGIEAGWDLILPATQLESVRSQVRAASWHELTVDEVTLMRLKAGLPAFPEDLNEETLFAEAGLKAAVSFKKGCYVGQEVIEKVDALGRLPRRIASVRFEGSVIPPRGAPLTSASGALVGEITSIAFDTSEGRSYALASIKNSTEFSAGATVSAGGSMGVLTA